MQYISWFLSAMNYLECKHDLKYNVQAITRQNCNAVQILTLICVTKLPWVVTLQNCLESKVHGANMGPTWVLSAQDGPHVGPMNFAIRVVICQMYAMKIYFASAYQGANWHAEAWNIKLLRMVSVTSISYAANACVVIVLCLVFGNTWWRHQMEPFSALLALCAGNSSVPVNSSHKGQWRGALMFSLICARINDWVNNSEAGDLRRYRGHYDVNVMNTSRFIRPIKNMWICR